VGTITGRILSPIDGAPVASAQVRLFNASAFFDAVTTDAQDPNFYHAVERSFPVPGLVGRITRVTARVLLRPIRMGLVEELLTSGHLTLDVRPEIPTHVVGSSVLEWTATAATAGCVQ
jgi:hypothetical protein